MARPVLAIHALRTIKGFKVVDAKTKSWHDASLIIQLDVEIPMPIDKTFEPANVEARIHEKWEKAEAFKAKPDPNKEAFSIVIPPPNVTGSLHMGHALNNTLQDILCRFERMRGKDVLWQVGTDHAGIATQMVVERKLAEKGEDRRDLGREEFLKRVWDWKEESGGTIIAQLKRLGASCDWSREKFTMGEKGTPDDQMVKAVTKVFVELYNTLEDGTKRTSADQKGLIYRDKRLVNWDPHFQTAISDLEVLQVEKRGSFKWEKGAKNEAGEEVAFDAQALEKVLKKDPHGHMYYINYPLEGVVYNPDDASTFITVATTRPETLLGDTAVAVHPENEKYKHLIGKKVVLPLIRVELRNAIPIVGDDYADPEKGTGAVKITPAHDFNDFEVGKRHFVETENIFTKDMRIVSSHFDEHASQKKGEHPEYRTVVPDQTLGRAPSDWIPSLFKGLNRYIARQVIVEKLVSANYLTKIEPTTHMVPHGDRSGVAIEPYLTDQWYVNVKPLAEKAMEAARSGKTKFVPQNWEKTYFQWLENIEPWCISRQLWWGHQVPVWYLNNNKFFVANSRSEAVKLALHYLECKISEKREFYKDKIAKGKTPIELKEYELSYQSLKDNENSQVLRRDEDVLDTWFSSALWPFSTMGWPEETDELKRYYPTSVLITGFDIIFFWVARMMMMGMHFMKDDQGEGIVPFKDVYIHALVRDATGAKMSKSKGNVIDPLQLIDQYGADALRFTLAAMAAQGRDIKLSLQRVEGYRNFATKLWNAARFAEMNGCGRVDAFDPSQVKETLNQWALHECAVAIKDITAFLEGYRFNDAANRAYRFVWNVFCDWYLELAKPVLQGEEGTAKEETRATIDYLIDQICKLLHPFMPFLTEELWEIRGSGGDKEALLTLSPWPNLSHLENPQAEAEIGWVVDVISEIRSARSETNVPAATLVPLVLVNAPRDAQARAMRWADMLKRLARLSDISLSDTPPAQAIQLQVRGVTLALPLAGVIDLDAERARLEKEQTKARNEIASITAKLSNEAFLNRAPEEVVEEQRERLDELQALSHKLQEAYERLQAA
jgi:valyl-tRNA synthetase